MSSDMQHAPRHSVSVAAVITNEHNQVLVIRRADNGHWEIPGGVLELAEGLEDGVRREVVEETGVSVVVDGLSGVYKNLARGIVALVFRCHLSSGVAQPTEEAVDVRWISASEVQANMDPAFAIRVLDALTPGTHYRDHNGVHLTTPLTG